METEFKVTYLCRKCCQPMGDEEGKIHALCEAELIAKNGAMPKGSAALPHYTKNYGKKGHIDG